MEVKELEYDVVVFGAGVAGCAIAIALKKGMPNLRIAIVERKNKQVNTKDYRSIGETIPPQTVQQLQNLGLWNRFLTKGFIKSYGTSSSWGSSELYFNEFIYSANGYGWNLDRAVFDQFMIDETCLLNVDVFYDTKVISLNRESKVWNIVTNSQNIRSSFVVDATGKKAAIATKLGVEQINKDQLIGIYRFYDGEIKNQSNVNIQEGTLVESVLSGWWYSTTLPNNQKVLAYMTDADIAKKQQLHKPENFDAILKCSNYTKERVLEGQIPVKTKIVAAHTQCLDRSIGDGWLSVGDATMSYDPLSSSGIFKSLVTAQIASFAIRDYFKGNDLGLFRYQEMMKNEFLKYQNKKVKYYSQEQRYSANEFWKRRIKPLN